MEIRLLHYFLAIAREQSITKAAQALHVSQSTLSKQMQELEQELGRTLFVRGPRRITLTDDGIYLRAHAQEILTLVEKTETALKNSAAPEEGDIYLGCGETAIMKDVLQVFRELRQDYPGFRLHLYSGNAKSVMEELEKGMLDLGLLLDPVKNDRYDYLQLPEKDAFGLLLRRDDPLAEKPAISPSDLADIPIFLPRQAEHRLPLPKMNNIVGSINLVSNATYLVELGMGCVLTLENLVTMSPERNLTFRPIRPGLTLDAYIVTKKYQSFSTPARLFLERLQERFR